VAITVTGVELATLPAVTVKVWLLMPAATVTFACTGNAVELLLERVTVSPPVGAFPFNVTVPVDICPEATIEGLKEIIVTTGGLTVRSAMSELPASVAVIFESLLKITGNVVTLKFALVEPAGTFTLTGTVATAILLLVKVTVTPPVGAGPVSVTVPCEVIPPATGFGFKETPPRDGGITVRVPVMFKLDPEVADTVAVIDVETGLVVAVNVCDVLPAGTVTPVGRITFGSELESDTNTPPEGAAGLITTVPIELFPPTTLAGTKLTRTTGGGRTMMFTETMIDPVLAVTVTGVGVLTAPAVTINV